MSSARFNERLNHIPKWANAYVGLLLFFLVWLFDHATPRDLSFAIFYIIPIAFMAWRIGGVWNIIMPALSALAWLEADLAAQSHYSHALIPYWNAIVRLFFFFLTAYVLGLRRRFESELEQKVAAQEETRRRLEFESALRDIGGLCLREMPRKELFDKILERMSAMSWLAEEPGAGIFLFDPAKGELIRQSWRGRGQDQRICAAAAVSGAVEFYAAGELGQAERSGYCVPIRQNKSTLGFIQLCLGAEHRRDENEVQFLESLASLLALVLGRQAARQELEASRHYMGAIINALGDPVFVKDRSHRWVLLNDACCAFLGYSREQLLGKSDPDFFPKEQCDVFWAKDDQVFETGQPDINEEFITDAAGRIHTSSTLKTRYTDQAGEQFIVGVIRDITEAKRVEAEKARLADQLQQAQKMEAVGHLAGGIAHDFNNVLTMIMGYNYFLLDGLKPDNPLLAFSKEVRRGTEMAASLSRQFLAITRRQVLRPRVLDVNAVLLETTRLFRRLLGEDIEVEVEPLPSAWPVKMDSGQLEQLILNLVINARDAMPQGGRLKLATKNLSLVEPGQPEVVPPGQYVGLEVHDTGIGMDEALQRKIFEPFFTTKPSGRGTGLGLFVTREIVKGCGGGIAVESAPGKGSVFRVYLPRAEGGVAALLPGKVSKAAQGGQETVLVVEDHPALLALVKKVLRQKGYRVFSAESGHEARASCDRSKEHIDLLLTDLVLPDISGVELADKLCALRPGLRVVYMSGYPGGVAAAIRLPESAVLLEKPFTPDVLLDAVRRALDEKQPSVR